MKHLGVFLRKMDVIAMKKITNLYWLIKCTPKIIYIWTNIMFLDKKMTIVKILIVPKLMHKFNVSHFSILMAILEKKNNQIVKLLMCLK